MTALWRIGLGSCLAAMATVAQAATPITLPFGDLGLQVVDAIELPVPPPPPPASRPEVAPLRVIIKRQPVRNSGCDQASPAGERRQVALPAPTQGVRPIQLG